jgi:hypothetical protein
MPLDHFRDVLGRPEAIAIGTQTHRFAEMLSRRVICRIVVASAVFHFVSSFNIDAAPRNIFANSFGPKTSAIAETSFAKSSAILSFCATFVFSMFVILSDF